MCFDTENLIIFCCILVFYLDNPIFNSPYDKLFLYHFKFGAKINKYVCTFKNEKVYWFTKGKPVVMFAKKIPKINGPKAYFFLRKCIGVCRMYMINCGCLSPYHSG